ncbi:Ubiquitin-conjugating enzyme E2 J1-like [Oopsacas minuta]|uniref:Ubiquitin-conjugating enzyme E2 J1-like n=1 Tax=Oopsacas minuta TaxID=111878 RepID=A0AAV7K5C8_9METZ|nr:Ubiquitin-conjugating enzyme E2 J1-like [Oopsacas minuta]
MSRMAIRSPAVKRLMKEAKELNKPTAHFFTQPLEENLFEWHFTVKGPSDTAFEGGRYHGRIVFPPEYPMKPPSIIMLTENGRFSVNNKLCLSISNFHPESWEPSWSIRTVLMAIIAYMPMHGEGAIGSLDCTSSERAKLAVRSSTYKCRDCKKTNLELLPEVEEVPGEIQELLEEASDVVKRLVIKPEAPVAKKQRQEPPQDAISLGEELNDPAQELRQQIFQQKSKQYLWTIYLLLFFIGLLLSRRLYLIDYK